MIGSVIVRIGPHTQHDIKYKTLSLGLSLICFIEVIIELSTGSYFQISIQEMEFVNASCL